jgi:predicted alpha/beta-fold hydrolase
MNSKDLTFQPPILFQNRHFQTIVSSLHRHKETTVQQAAQEILLNAAGVRLLGFYSPQINRESKGLVLLLPGWMGSANSGYIVSMGEYLYQRGYAIFRLNLRDHGNTHHLNPGIFRSDRLDEVFTATQQIAQLESDRRFHIIGNSLGGNFALRLAWRHSQTPIPNLEHTIAFCPVIDPYKTTLSMDNGPWIYLHYFRGKWRRGFQKKQAAYPDQYDFAEEIAATTCMEMTEVFVRRHSPYTNARAYLDAYAVKPKMMKTLTGPVTVIPAADDPVIPIADFYDLCDLTPNLRVHIQSYGGHMGFVELFPFRLWSCAAVDVILNHHAV